MRRKKKFTSALSFVLSLLMAASCIQPVMAAQTVPDVESVSGEAAAQAEENEDTNVSVSAAPAKEETSEAPAETTESTQEESDFDSGSIADLTEKEELKSESSDATEPAALSDPEISPLADTAAYAILYESGELVFQRGSTPDAGKGKVLGTYTGFETKKYTGYNDYAPWYKNKTSIKAVSFKDVVKPVSTAYWFYSCNKLTDADFTNLDTSAVTSMFHMFSYCSSLTSLDVSSFNTLAVTSMDGMFSYCSSLTSLDLSSFNTSAVTSMDGMFYSCSSLTSLDVSSFDTSEVTDMAYMFDDCRSLTSLDLSSFNTSAVTSMDSMCYDCNALETLTLGTKFAFKRDTKLVDATWHGFNTGKEYTTSVLTSTYDGPTMADTYVKLIDIKFDALDGKASESKKSGYIGMAFDSLPTAEKRGYDFVGWFTEKQGGTQLLVNQPITQSTYYAQYTEHKYTITVTNDVAGTMGDKTKDFAFQLKMTGNTPAELHYTKGTETGTLKVTDGVVEFTLSDGESITLGNILIDTTYKITEVDGASNGYAVESTNSSGTLTEDTDVSFTNTRNGTVPTSAHTNILISIGVFAIALAGLFWHLRKRKQ